MNDQELIMRSTCERYEMLLARQQLEGTSKPSKTHDSVKNTGLLTQLKRNELRRFTQIVL